MAPFWIEQILFKRHMKQTYKSLKAYGSYGEYMLFKKQFHEVLCVFDRITGINCTEDSFDNYKVWSLTQSWGWRKDKVMDHWERCERRWKLKHRK